VTDTTWLHGEKIRLGIKIQVEEIREEISSPLAEIIHMPKGSKPGLHFLIEAMTLRLWTPESWEEAETE
jgi:hypothetical protein